MIIADILKEAVDKYGDEICIVDKGIYRKKKYSYNDIYNQSLALCKHFRNKDIKKGDKVVVYLPNSSDYATILWACAISGVVAVPIDFNNNIDFVGKIYKNVDAKCVFASALRNPNLKNVFFVEMLGEIYSSGSKNFRLNNNLSEEDLFEIVYTSGTTSEPKGAMITNKNIVANVVAVKERIRFKSKNVVALSILPLSHLFEQTVGFFLAMIKNYKLVYISSKKSSAISKAINEEKVNVIVSVPLFLNGLKEKIEKMALEKGRIHSLKNALERYKESSLLVKRIIFRGIRKKFKTLEYFVVGGSSLGEEVETFWETLGVAVLQGYGLTETSPILTCNEVESRKVGTVGKIIDGVEVRLVDGEIVARGDNVFSGYYKNKKETNNILKNGWIYTGDVGEFDDNRNLKITGRKKNMILSPSGTNVYPEDIEKVLNKITGVRESVVLGLNNGQDLVGVILPNSSVNDKDILKIANSKLSTHQYLTKIHVWKGKDFPRTPTKKVKRSLVVEGISGNEILEKSGDVLIDILSEVCKKNSSEIKENVLLKNLGLDSLKRLELSVKIEESFNIEINEDGINETTTLKNLRKIITDSRHIKIRSGINFLNSRFFNPIRFILQGITFGLTKISYRSNIEGVENLPDEQCIFIANHTSHLDTVEILRSLPLKKRLNTGFAAAKDVFFSKKLFLVGILTKLFFNTFPFSRDKEIKQSLMDFGKVVDNGFNVVIFPEGTRSKTGEMGSFKNGIGLLAWNIGLPIVPIKLKNLYEIMPKGQPYWKFTTIKPKIKIGKPIRFNKMQSPLEITKTLEATILGM